MTRVLIIEDHQTLLRSLRRGLEVVGFDVLVTETGEEGFNLALSRDVDLLVMDVMLPGRSGFEILQDLRNADFRKPVLILTAKESSEDRRRAQACGADGFLAKPFSFAELLARIEQLLQKSEAKPLSMEEP
jgi:two-component system copper resistance phosphate regulon response regulator CusR